MKKIHKTKIRYMNSLDKICIKKIDKRTPMVWKLFFVCLEKFMFHTFLFSLQRSLCSDIFGWIQNTGWASWTKCPLKIFRLYGCIYSYIEYLFFSTYVKWDVAKLSLLCNFCSLSHSLSLFLFFLLFHISVFILLRFSQVYIFFSQLLRINVICRLCYFFESLENKCAFHQWYKYNQWVVECQKIQFHSIEHTYRNGFVSSLSLSLNKMHQIQVMNGWICLTNQSLEN